MRDDPPGDNSIAPFPLGAAPDDFQPSTTRGGDLVSLFRKNNSMFNNMVQFTSPKVSPVAVVSEAKPKVEISEFPEEKASVDEEVSAPAPTPTATKDGVKRSPLQSLRSHYRFNGLSIISPVPVIATQTKSTEGLENMFDNWLWDRMYKSWSEGYLKALLLWSIWMAAATTFYAVRNKMGFAKGFFMAVNVGYSIGSSYPRELDRVSLWFSVFNILLGVVALGVGLNAFAYNIINTGKTWYEEAEYSRAMADKNMPPSEKTSVWLVANKYKVYTIAAFLCWGSAMTMWASYAFKHWKFPQALYFAVSSLSTGGLYPMPENVPRYFYVIAGLFISLGVPLMCVAMGNIAAMLLKFGDPEEDKRIIRGQVSIEEIEMMKEFGIDDGDGFIDRAEFILLCAVRLGAATPELIEEINKRFVTLDTGKRGALTREELLQVKSANKMLVNDIRRERTGSTDSTQY